MRKVFVISWGFALGLCATPSRAQSAWYVDNSVNGGAHNGTSWANAWPSLVAISWSSIHPGDTLYISGGNASQTYTEIWTVGTAGISGKPITISVGQDAGHNGVVIFDYSSLGTSATENAITVPNYVTITGSVAGQNHIQCDNLVNTSVGTSAICVYSSTGVGITVDHLTFINDNNPIRFNAATSGFTASYNSFQGVRGDAVIGLGASTGTWDSNRIFGNSMEMLAQFISPGYYGPDGIQGLDGVSIYNNSFKETSTAQTTSSQHPDMMQIAGNYTKVYGNDFVNVGDSVFDHDCYRDPDVHDIYIYNNTFRIVTAIDPYPEYFRLYSSSGAISSIVNVKLLNNTFIDNNDQYWVVRFEWPSGSNPTGAGNEIKNNIFYNVGRGSSSAVYHILSSSNFTATSFAFANNVYYQDSETTSISYLGTLYTAVAWSAIEPTRLVGQPLLVSYSPNSINNDLHLQSSDTVAKDTGVDLSSYFTTDKDGVTRPKGPAWDRGAYEQGTVTINPCDLTHDGTVDGSDVALAVNMALGTSACTADIIGSGVCNVVVVQRVVNAALPGGICSVN